MVGPTDPRRISNLSRVVLWVFVMASCAMPALAQKGPPSGGAGGTRGTGGTGGTSGTGGSRPSGGTGVSPGSGGWSTRDTGPGISPQERAIIFQEYKQTKEERTRRRGTGLGLAMTRRLVAMHGGSIQVESEVGRGSVFQVLLPAWSDARGGKG